MTPRLIVRASNRCPQRREEGLHAFVVHLGAVGAVEGEIRPGAKYASTCAPASPVSPCSPTRIGPMTSSSRLGRRVSSVIPFSRLLLRQAVRELCARLDVELAERLA